MSLNKHFNPSEVEEHQYRREEASGAFRACQVDGKPYSIVIPPPNVTGSLHIGHALNNTLQDILIRFERMRGRDVLWQPGTDHAGIATQMVVEKQLSEEGIILDRGDVNKNLSSTNKFIGREEFIQKVWQWKSISGGTILNQLRRLGATCDWDRERFTMDEGLSLAVRNVFVKLYKQGLIYKDQRLVNWDPKLHTAISDLEVESRETKGHMWHIKYPIEGQNNLFIVVATTRPETMLGDTAVAVNPEDKRYKEFIGKNAVLPVSNRLIPIIADHHADPESGTGAVKITPAHDFNDFEVGKRHKLETINIFDRDACINENAPDNYRGLDRFHARDQIVSEIESLGLLETVIDHTLSVPYGDRSGAIIEPWLTEQWYVNAETLANPAIKAVENGDVSFIPKQWENTFFSWMRNIQPWCISRQLWWGHRIPAWYGPDGHVFVELDELKASEAARNHYGNEVKLVQETDVLDTWFSSALWPFSTLGWPEETIELSRFYPTSVLVTSFDIIFFWVARMMMMGIHFMGEPPFRNVYIHPLVRDEKGQKMSKSKGNVIDPLEFIDKYGTDSLRFTLTALAAQGREIKLSVQRVEGYRNFTTKIWNAARFCEMNQCVPNADFIPDDVSKTANRWIVGLTSEVVKEVTNSLENFRYNDAAASIYQFTWGSFCDWYLEFIKPLLNSNDELAKRETRSTAAWTLSQILHLLHPIMPFITEEIWERISRSPKLLITSSWPDLSHLPKNTDAAMEMDWVIRLVSQIRAVRAEVNVPVSARIPMLIRGANSVTLERLNKHAEEIHRLARLESSSVDDNTDALVRDAAQIVIDESIIILPLGNFIDINAEKDRLDKEIDKILQNIQTIEKKLSDTEFISRAPKHVVDEQHERLSSAKDSKDRLSEALQRLG